MGSKTSERPEANSWRLSLSRMRCSGETRSGRSFLWCQTQSRSGRVEILHPVDAKAGAFAAGDQPKGVCAEIGAGDAQSGVRRDHTRGGADLGIGGEVLDIDIIITDRDGVDALIGIKGEGSAGAMLGPMRSDPIWRMVKV